MCIYQSQAISATGEDAKTSFQNWSTTECCLHSQQDHEHSTAGCYNNLTRPFSRKKGTELPCKGGAESGFLELSPCESFGEAQGSPSVQGCQGGGDQRPRHWAHTECLSPVLQMLPQCFQQTTFQMRQSSSARPSQLS